MVYAQTLLANTPHSRLLSKYAGPVSSYQFFPCILPSQNGHPCFVLFCFLHMTELYLTVNLTKRGPLEKGMANHFSILALRTP